MHYIMLPKSINSLRTIVFGRFRWVSPFWAEVKFGCYKVLSHPFIYAAFRLNSVVQLKCRSSPYWGCFWLGISSHDSLEIFKVWLLAGNVLVHLQSHKFLLIWTKFEPIRKQTQIFFQFYLRRYFVLLDQRTEHQFIAKANSLFSLKLSNEEPNYQNSTNSHIFCVNNLTN